MTKDSFKHLLTDLYSYYKKTNYNYADPIGIKKDKKKAKKASNKQFKSFTLWQG